MASTDDPPQHHHRGTLRQSLTLAEEFQRIKDPLRDDGRPSSFNTSHRTSVEYPARPHLYSTHFKKPHICTLIPKDCGSRYAPAPLIDSKAVKVHSGWEDPDESSFFSYTYTDQEAESGTPALDIAPLRSMRALAWDMGWAELHIGTTVLRVLDICDMEDQEFSILFEKTTSFYRRDGTGLYERTHYLIAHDLWTEMRCPVGDTELPAWVGLVDDLRYRRSDRAAKHVKDSTLKHFGFDIDLGEGWLPPRSFEVGPLIDEAFKPVAPETLEEDSKACMMCAQEFGGEDCTPLLLQCGKAICRSCLETWARSKPFEQLHCPFCRQEVIPASALHSLVFGLDEHGHYIPDPRFDAWENFERSCADLDSHLASNTTRSIWVRDADILDQALDILTKGALLQPESSTPHHLQSIRAPEWRHIHSSIRKVMAQLSYGLRPMEAFNKDFESAVFADFAAMFQANGVAKYFPASQRAQQSKCPWCVFLRPGIAAFAKRMISRMLMMVDLRRCTEHPGVAGWHKHGARDFYTPAVGCEAARQKAVAEEISVAVAKLAI